MVGGFVGGEGSSVAAEDGGGRFRVVGVVRFGGFDWCGNGCVGE